MSQIRIQVLTDSMPDGKDKLIVDALFTCSGIVEREGCSGTIQQMLYLCSPGIFSAGTCVWNPARNECVVSVLYLASLYAGHASNSSKDALCTILSIDGSSQCYDIFTQAECLQKEFCKWSAGVDCLPDEEFFISVAADEDPRLKRKYRRFKKQCSSRATALACEA